MVALDAGMDPIHFLGLTGTDLLVARLVLEGWAEQQEKRIENDRRAMANAVQTGVARAFKGR